MEELNFMTTTGDELTLQCSSNEKMKEIFKKYAEKIGKNHRQLIFFLNGSKIDKKLIVKEFQKKSKKDDFILVKIMDSNVENDSDDEKSKVLKKEILEEFKNPDKNITYEQMQELVVQYGYETEKKIEEEMKKNPENFIDIEDAIKQKDSNEGLFVLGKLGESLKDMGIKVAIDKRNIKSEDSIINNQFISSGIIKKNKYEIHIDEKDSKKKYEILNNENEQNKFKEEWKEKISKCIKVPKDDIVITNFRNGSITIDVIFKRTEIKDELGSKINIDEGMKKFANTNDKVISITSKNILGCCKLTLDMLDPRGNQNPNGWAGPGSERGGFEYFPPDSNWIGYGLVLDQYDNGNNDWIQMNGNPNEWAVAYHGTSYGAVKPVISKEGKFFSTRAEGATGQKCEDEINIHPLTQKQYPLCGEGTYCSPHLEYAHDYAKFYKSNGIIIMCRVNPKLIRIPKTYAKNEWITDGTKGTIRPYRLLCRVND